MKQFVLYTALRVLLLVASFGLIVGVWGLVADHVPVVWALLLALVLSGVTSYWLLRRPREDFARVVEQRAGRATANFERMRAKEDVD